MLAAFAVASLFFPVSVVAESMTTVSVVAVSLAALFLVFLVVVAAEV